MKECTLVPLTRTDRIGTTAHIATLFFIVLSAVAMYVC